MCLEHGWIADGSTGADDECYCANCDEPLGYYGTDWTNHDGEMICEHCKEGQDERDRSDEADEVAEP